MNEKYYIIAFDSTHHAIGVEKIFKEAKKEVLMIPTPREISSSCGLSLKINEENIFFAQKQLKEKNMSYHGIFMITLEKGRKSIEKLEE